MKKRIIITYKYPYCPPTEVFLHQELQTQDERNLETLIIPTASSINYSDCYYDNDANKPFRASKDNGSSKIIKCLKGSCIVIPFMLGDFFAGKINGVTAKTIVKNYLWCAYKYGVYIDDIFKFAADADELIIYSYWFGVYALLACFVKKQLLRKYPEKKIKLICRAHGQGDLYNSPGLTHRIGVKAYNCFIDEAFPISELGKNELEKELNRPVVRVARLGVDGCNSYLEKSTNDSFLIVSCSTINDNKRVDLIFESIRRVTGRNIKWIHFGDGERFEELQKKVQAQANKDLSIELNGNTENNKILAFYKSNHPDLFMNLSLVEGLPVSIMEAMAYSIPVLCTDTGATSEIVCNNINGFLVNVDDSAETIAHVIMNFMKKDSNQQTEYRNAAYYTWREKFQAEKNYNDFVIVSGQK